MANKFASDFVASETVGGFNNHITEQLRRLQVLRQWTLISIIPFRSGLATVINCNEQDMDSEYGTMVSREQIDMLDNCANDLRQQEQ